MSMSSRAASPIVIDLTIRNQKCSFCAENTHVITQCFELRRFEDLLLAKWRDNIQTPEVFMQWVRETHVTKMVPYTRRIYVWNQQKTGRFDEFSCMAAIVNRMNILNLGPLISDNIRRFELTQQQQLLDDIEEDQRIAAENESFQMASGSSSSSALGNKRKMVFILDDGVDQSEHNIEHECVICQDSFKRKKMIRLNCRHLFCGPCGTKLRSDFSNCALCREPITESFVIALKKSKAVEEKEIEKDSLVAN
jgi:hypothetical protein